VGSFAIPVATVLVLLWARSSGTPWRNLGFARPRSWLGLVAAGAVFGCALKLVMKALVMPLLGADPVNPTYHYLAGNTAMLPAAIVTMLVAGFGEETVFRGFLFERLGKLFGSSVAAKAAIVLLTTLLFAALHYPDQGWTGAEQAFVTGLVFGGIFARTGRIWMLMCAHAAYDLTAVALIYANLESGVAHLVFK
jgi:membrane protease YdiL (CAAX protease family)